MSGVKTSLLIYEDVCVINGCPRDGGVVNTWENLIIHFSIYIFSLCVVFHAPWTGDELWWSS